ncbi:MAG: hypothetical protein WCC66_08615, partial [Rhizobiaceae bacterium]
ANTGENSLGRISMRPSGLSLVLPQNPSDTIASTQKHPALAAFGLSVKEETVPEPMPARPVYPPIND